MIELKIILRISAFLVSALSVLLTLASTWNIINFTGGVFLGSFVTYIFIFFIPAFGFWSIFHFIYFDNFINESRKFSELLKRSFVVLLISCSYLSVARIIENFFFYRMTNQIILEKIDYISLAFSLLIVPVLLSKFLKRKYSFFK